MKLVLVCVAVFHLTQATFNQRASNDYFHKSLSEAQNISQWCELLNIDDCEKAVNSLPTSIVLDDTGKKLDMLGDEEILSELSAALKPDQTISYSASGLVSSCWQRLFRLVPDVLLHYVMHKSTMEAYRENLLTERISEAYDNCRPREQTVMIPQRPGHHVFPPCISVLRCAGCCMTTRFSCQPLSKTVKDVSVVYTEVLDPRKSNRRHTIDQIHRGIVKIEAHVSCLPACRVQENDCKKNQRYDPNGCRCLCGPEMEKRKNECKGNLHIWNEATCECVCKNRKTTTDCPSSTKFSPKTCKCKPTSVIGKVSYFDQLFARAEDDEQDYDNKEQDGDDEISIAAEEQQRTSVLKDPCFNMKCSGGLKPMKLRSGKCHCLPYLRRNVLEFDQQSP